MNHHSDEQNTERTVDNKLPYPDLPLASLIIMLVDFLPLRFGHLAAKWFGQLHIYQAPFFFFSNVVVCLALFGSVVAFSYSCGNCFFQQSWRLKRQQFLLHVYLLLTPSLQHLESQ